jgi:hypothetical protein
MGAATCTPVAGFDVMASTERSEDKRIGELVHMCVYQTKTRENPSIEADIKSGTG